MSTNTEQNSFSTEEEVQQTLETWKIAFVQSVKAETDRAAERHSSSCARCGRSRYSVYQKVWSLLSIESLHSRPYLLKKLAIVTQYGCNSVRFTWTRKTEKDSMRVLTRKLEPTLELTDELRWLVYKNLSTLATGLHVSTNDCVADLTPAAKVCLLDSVDSVIAASVYYGWQPQIQIGRRHQ